MAEGSEFFPLGDSAELGVGHFDVLGIIAAACVGEGDVEDAGLVVGIVMIGCPLVGSGGEAGEGKGHGISGNPPVVCANEVAKKVGRFGQVQVEAPANHLGSFEVDCGAAIIPAGRHSDGATEGVEDLRGEAAEDFVLGNVVLEAIHGATSRGEVDVEPVHLSLGGHAGKVSRVGLVGEEFGVISEGVAVGVNAVGIGAGIAFNDVVVSVGIRVCERGAGLPKAVIGAAAILSNPLVEVAVRPSVVVQPQREAR